jgi:hypothetical protein
MVDEEELVKVYFSFFGFSPAKHHSTIAPYSSIIVP